MPMYIYLVWHPEADRNYGGDFSGSSVDNSDKKNLLTMITQ
jgi:hypothetical protein